jgi:rare lipoprotein A
MNHMNIPFRLLAMLLASLFLLEGCGTFFRRGVTVSTLTRPPAPRKPGGGGYYKDDGPADASVDLDAVPDAVPRMEPLNRWANRPYEVLGKRYVPLTELKPFRQEGIGSWYGKKFHGQKTSIGETYDMFAMTAAHPTLPLPSYVRVTNPANGQSVVVRVNDRGPFHAGRIIDLSYAAAYRLGYVQVGSSRVVVESILPNEAPVYAAAVPLTPIPPAPPAMLPRDGEALDALSRRLAETEFSPLEAEAAFMEQRAEQGVFLQLGAFASAENAENMRNHLLRELDWLGGEIRIRREDQLHRLQLGPYPSRIDAEQVSARIQADLGYVPTIISR